MDKRVLILCTGNSARYDLDSMPTSFNTIAPAGDGDELC
jgi:hypothetical protein